MIVIRCVHFEGIAQHPSAGSPEGQFLRNYEPEAFDGQGFATWTEDVNLAMKFETAVEAWNLWRTVPKNRPIRPDGLPNRPLTAFTIEIAGYDG